MKKLIIDIETIRANDYKLFMPEEIKNPPEFKPEQFKPEVFSPDKVKRLKKDTDETYKAKVEQSEIEHKSKQEEKEIEHSNKQVEKEIEHNNYYAKKQKDWESKLALSPLTGQIACVGTAMNNSLVSVWRQYTDTITVTEKDIIIRVLEEMIAADLIIGHNIKDFDLWFIFNRCRKHGLEFPRKLYNTYKGRFTWQDNIIDTMDLWSCGKYKEYISLDNLAKFFGIEGKDNTISKNFEEVWNADRNKAIEHCKKDVLLTKQIYELLK